MYGIKELSFKSGIWQMMKSLYLLKERIETNDRSLELLKWVEKIIRMDLEESMCQTYIKNEYFKGNTT